MHGSGDFPYALAEKGLMDVKRFNPAVVLLIYLPKP
jgi:hypothetical protein